MSIVTLIQYLIKEYFIYVMAAYTLLFVVAATLFVRYRTNRHRPAQAHHAAEHGHISHRPAVSVTGNKLVLQSSKALQPFAVDFLKVLAGLSELYVVVQVRATYAEEKNE